MRLVIAAAALAWGAVAMAQTKVIPPEDSEPSIYSPGSRIVRQLPSEEALALGRRIAVALHGDAAWKRVNALLEKTVEKAGPPLPERRPDGPIRAIPLFRPLHDPTWGILLHARAIDHAGLVYAWRYNVDELRQMAHFVESPVGRKFLGEREEVLAEIGRVLGGSHLDEDFADVVCRIRIKTDRRDEHRDLARLHPPPDLGVEPPPPPVWCGGAVPGVRE
jgi:hypothetical protein